jgi:hypothetical protein
VSILLTKALPLTAMHIATVRPLLEQDSQEESTTDDVKSPSKGSFSHDVRIKETAIKTPKKMLYCIA